jgi:GPH family glycoside/pentoside/hexuronide:cation symporter
LQRLNGKAVTGTVKLYQTANGQWQGSLATTGRGVVRAQVRVWPGPQGDAALLPMQINSFVAGIGTGFVSVAYPSMMADAADEHEHLFGHRREGLYFAGLGFANKAASGLGVMVAGVALDLVRFPAELGQTVGAVLPADVQFRLVMVWGPVPAVIAIVALLIFVSYNITRARHAEIAAGLGRGPAPG